MSNGRWDIGEYDIKEVHNEIDDPALRTSEFIHDKRFDILSKTIEYKHIDQQVCPVCMYKSRC